MFALFLALMSAAMFDSIGTFDQFKSVAVNAAPAISDCMNKQHNYPETVTRWSYIICPVAEKKGFDPALLYALIWQESGGNPMAYSHSGAVGLMQVMASDGKARQLYGSMFKNRPTVAQLQDPETNIDTGTAILKGCLKEYGNMRDALKCYGPMDVGYSYADRVLKLSKR